MNAQSIKTIAIVGNPNCGKTTLFNKLTGSQQKVGNWAGVTVERKEGIINYKNKQLKLVDLPGVYSLSVPSATSAVDELIACRYILSGEADIIVNIIDGANLKRNLYLTIQLLEMGIPCIVAVNMLDIAEQCNMQLDLAKLSAELGCPVLPLVCKKNQGIDQLKKTLVNYDIRTKSQRDQITTFPLPVETAITQLQTAITSHYPNVSPAISTTLAIKLLEQDVLAREMINNDQILTCTADLIKKISLELGEDVDIVMADCRYAFINTMIASVCQTTASKDHVLTKWLDNIVLNRIFGIPIFLLVMYLMFEFSMDVGAALQPLFDLGSSTLFVNGVLYLGATHHWPIWLTAILANGAGLGINTVLSFIPQIGLMFLCLSFLEDSGYMARAAFVMDRFMQAVGLPGKSFIPLIVGFGCNVPSIMATRTLDNPRDRLLTILMTPFMSCGARLAIFVVFGTAFFPHHAGLMVFMLYITGILIAMLSGFIFKLTILKGESAPFIMELPVYHTPHFKTLLRLTWQRLKGFVKRAGKFIVPICVLIGTLNTIEINGTINPNGSQQSLLSYAGRAVTPVLSPMGVEQNNWPATVGLITGTLAKEVVVGTLNTLYTQTKVANNSVVQDYSLWGGLENAWLATKAGFRHIFSATMLNPFTANEADHTMSQSALGNMQQAFPSWLAAYAYLLFVLLYVPCVSTMGTIAREVGVKWAYFSTGWSILIAYTVAVTFYQFVTFFTHPLSSVLWMFGLTIVNTGFIWLLKQCGNIRVSPTGVQTKPGSNHGD
ncbi:MAG: Fe(2+) transporter permease subunit FeoB [Gammaproteobacteria bacterium]